MAGTSVVAQCRRAHCGSILVLVVQSCGCAVAQETAGVVWLLMAVYNVPSGPWSHLAELWRGCLQLVRSQPSWLGQGCSTISFSLCLLL